MVNQQNNTPVTTYCINTVPVVSDLIISIDVHVLRPSSTCSTVYSYNPKTSTEQ